MIRKYRVVDVFSSQPLRGNPVAVVLDADGLDAATMQSIARWSNLSETTFVLPPTHAEADYTLRIFTPQSELPFAGHPTLGSAHAVVEAGLVTPKAGRLVQQCGMGLVDVVTGTAQDQIYFLNLPAASLKAVGDNDIRTLENALGCGLEPHFKTLIVDVGAVWCVAEVQNVEQLLSITPDYARLAEFDRGFKLTGVTLFARKPGGEFAIEVRSFAPSCGVNEDPVCGSGNGSVAVSLIQNGIVPSGGLSYQATQGQCIGRDGLIKVSIDDKGKILVGGACVTTVSGKLVV